MRLTDCQAILYAKGYSAKEAVLGFRWAKGIDAIHDIFNSRGPYFRRGMSQQVDTLHDLQRLMEVKDIVTSLIANPLR